MGVPLEVEGKVQINFAVTNLTEIKPSAGLRPMIFPVVWFQDGVPKMDDQLVRDLRMGNNYPEVRNWHLFLLHIYIFYYLYIYNVMGGAKYRDYDWDYD